MLNMAYSEEAMRGAAPVLLGGREVVLPFQQGLDHNHGGVV